MRQTSLIMIDCTQNKEGAPYLCDTQFHCSHQYEYQRIQLDPFSSHNMYQLMFVNELTRVEQPATGTEMSHKPSMEHTSTGGTRIRKAPRPCNAFILYRQAKRAEIRAKHCKLHSSEISKVAAEMWKHEPETVRQQFARKADEEKLMHAYAYPGYKYQPQRKRKDDNTRRKWHPLEPKKAICSANKNAGAVHEFSEISPPSQCLDDSFLGTFLDDYTIFGLYQADVLDHQILCAYILMFSHWLSFFV